MPHKTIGFTPIPGAPLGAVVTLPEGVTDPSKLNDSDFQALKEGLLTHSVLVIPDMANLSPESQVILTKRMDPTCDGKYGHAKEFRHDQSVLRRDGVSVPDFPQVQILGQGEFENHCGHEKITLRHPTHFDFHKDVLSDEDVANNYTRFYRWHIDSALYGLSPPVCTTLLGIHVPNANEKKMKIRYEDTKEEIEVAQAGTAFFSGARAFDLLSDEDKEMALNTTVEYAPHPYIFISPARATSDGLTMVSEGKERKLDELPEWEESKIKKLPMVWTNPVTGRHHLQVHGCCVHKLHLPDGKVLGLEDARKEVYRLMRPAISPENIYVHAWQPGDLALFHNQGVLHSVTGQFAPGEKRLMHQCNIASGVDPVTMK